MINPTTLRTAFLASLLVGAVSAVALGVGIVAAIRDARGPNRLIVPLAVERAANAQVFYDRGAGIRAQDCATVGVPAGTMLREIAFPTPRVPLREVRFDPMPAAGTFRIGAPRLESASGRVIAKFPLAAVGARQQIATLRREGDHWLGVTTPGANDPQLTFGLGSPLRVGQPRIPWPEALVLVAALFIAVKLPRRRADAWDPAGADDHLSWDQWLLAAEPAMVACGALLVGFVEWWRLWPLQRTLDWPLWDEVNYAAAGAAWAQHGGGLGAFHNSPLYVVGYGVLAHFAGLAAAIFTQHYVVKIGSTVLLYLLLARWWQTWVGAAAVALLWGAGQFQLEFPLLVYQFGWAWFLAALVVVDRWPLAGLALATLATCARQEYQLAAVALAVWLGLRVLHSKWTWRDLLATEGGMVAGAIAAAAGFTLAGWIAAESQFGHSGERAWFAFEQHYAVRAVAQGEVTGINPWLDYAQVVERDFPGAKSLDDARRLNPRAMVRHIGYNVLHAPDSVAEFAHPHRTSQGLWVLLAAAVVALVSARRRPGGLETGSSLVLAAAGCAVVAPGLVVLADPAYLLAVVPLVLGGAGWLLARVFRMDSVGGRSLAAVALVAGAAVLATAPKPFVAGARPRPVAETVAELRAVWPATGRHTLLGVAASSYAHYIGDDVCRGVEALADVQGFTGRDSSLGHQVAERAPWAILVTDEWRRSARFDAKQIEQVLGSGWRMRTVPAGELYLSEDVAPR